MKPPTPKRPTTDPKKTAAAAKTRSRQGAPPPSRKKPLPPRDPAMAAMENSPTATFLPEDVELLLPRRPMPPLDPSPSPPHEAMPETERDSRVAADDDDADDDHSEDTAKEAPSALGRGRGRHRGADPDAPSPAVVAQIRELEAQLDRLIDEASRRDVSALVEDDDDDDDDIIVDESDLPDDDGDMEVTRDALPQLIGGRHRFADPERDREEDAIAVGASAAAPPIPAPRPSSPAARSSSPGLPQEATVFDTARELLSSDFYLRKWGRLAMRGRSEEVDDFGFDPIYEQKARAALEFLYTRYFRIETSGIDYVPARGRCLLVANHSGTLPLDGVMLKTAVKLEHSAPRDLRWLTEDFIYHMPYLGSIMNRLGAVRACQENAERLLAKEQLVAVFPEGVKGIGKLFKERYRLQRFGRGGFIKLCLRTQTPIVPVAVVGAEETNPLLFRFEYLSKALGLPYVPVTPTFPALGPLGLLPAPTKWQIHFGEPIDFGSHSPDAADDELLVGKLAERVRATIQGMLDRAVGSRKSVFFG